MPVAYLESALDSTRFPARTLQTTHRDRPLWVRYDLDAVRRSVTRDQLAQRPFTMWRYRELLPVDDDARIVSLNETVTPLVPAPRLAQSLGLRTLLIKDESRLPTGSFKARGLAMAVSMAKQFGVKRVAIPTAGNAGGALAAYAARAGIECFVFMPEDTPEVNRYEAAAFGARAFLVNGLITDCGKIVKEGAARMNWLECSTLKEPYRIEGKKTMGLELAEQLGWRLPGAIFYPTGGGTGLIGMWKAFAELEALGWLEDSAASKPRMFACQSSGCAPIVHAFDKGERFAEPPANPHTIASGIRVPKALGDFMILDAIRESRGCALAADEARILDWMRLCASLEGVSLCPESAACLDALNHAVKANLVNPDETVVLFNTGAMQKYTEAMRTDLPRLNHTNVDWTIIDRGAS